MPKKTTLCARLVLAAGSATLTAGPVLAQQASDVPELQRVEVTGSAIRRIDAETSVPVTVLKMEELRKQGVTTVEQVLATVSAMQSQQTTSQSVGAITGGASLADLRGLGSNKTLVLLNGRRLANNALSSSSPDLNTIPFAALERVEVLRDGASALYGTDAIGGVINFITRRSFNGGTVTLGVDVPQHAGGKNHNVNAGFGVGDLVKDRYNLLGFVDYQKQDPITGAQRPFGVHGKTSGVTFPATYFQGDPTFNPAAPACAGGFLVPSGAANCRYNTNLWIDYLPASERASGMLKGSVQVSENHRVDLEYFATRSVVSTAIAPAPFSGLTVNPGTAFYPGNGITPAPPAGSGIDPTQPITVQFRDVPNGGRRDRVENLQQRFVASLEGSLGAWDYKTGLSYNENRIKDFLTGGYTDGSLIAAGVADGTINPFGEQTAAGAALLERASATGELQSAKGSVLGVDLKASRDLGDWFGAGTPAAVALGGEVRRERFRNVGNPEFDQRVVDSSGFDPATNNEGSRSVSALYVELSVPLMKNLEITGALRYDKYSDFGSTTNPKLGFRFQPIQPVLVRGSYSTGFRAPSLYDLHSAQVFTFTANPWNDPVRCPNGVPTPGAPQATNCNTQFLSLLGGNPALKPETARNATLGLVVEPVVDLSVGIDFWWIKTKQQINSLPDTTVFGDPAKFAGLFHRAPDGSLSTSGAACPGANCGYVELITQNLGGVNTRGFDLSASYRWRAAEAGLFALSLTSTYVSRYEYQTEADGEWVQNVGVFSGTGPVFRWQHNATAIWSRGPLSAGLTAHHKSGYVDQNPAHRVGSNTTLDTYGAWQASKALALTFGVRNLLDRDPPFSNQGTTFQQGYDPRYADAAGRTFYARANYAF
jgi:iron complex outermembrane receptor protein